MEAETKTASIYHSMLQLTGTTVLAMTILLGLSQQSQAAELEIKIPENASTAWVSNNLNQNGMLLSIRTFHSPDDVESVLKFYRSEWFKDGDIPGFVENDMMDWKLISHKTEDENVVLQLKPTGQGGSTGFLSVAQLNGTSQPIDLDFPVPDSTEEYSSTFLEENGAEVLTMTFITKQTIGTTTSFYLDKLRRKGWSVAREGEFEGSHIMLFNRRDDQVEMVIQKLNEEDTVIFVNRVKRNV